MRGDRNRGALCCIQPGVTTRFGSEELSSGELNNERGKEGGKKGKKKERKKREKRTNRLRRGEGIKEWELR